MRTELLEPRWTVGESAGTTDSPDSTRGSSSEPEAAGTAPSCGVGDSGINIDSRSKVWGSSPDGYFRVVRSRRIDCDMRQDGKVHAFRQFAVTIDACKLLLSTVTGSPVCA